MAAHGLGRREHDSTGFGERQREEWGRHQRDDTRVVWVCAVDHCDDWVVGDDFKY